MRGIRTVALGLGLGLASVWMLTANANAETAEDGIGIDEILVTAQKRVQSKQDVPIALSAFTEQFLEDSGTDRLNDLVPFVPGLTGNDVGIGSPIYAVRGISSNSFGVGGEMSVGVFLDEGYIGRNKSSSIAFMDVQRVEVLKGPQGTLFGRNSSAGAISIISNKPVDEWYARANFVGGNFAKLAGSFTVNVPLVSEKLFVRGTFLGNQRNGYNHNMARGYEESDDIEIFAGKAAMRWLPSDTVDVTLSYLGQTDSYTNLGYKNAFDLLPQNPGTDPFGVGPDPFNGLTASDGRGDADRFVNNINLRVVADITDSLTLTSISMYNRYVFDNWTDGDGTAMPLLDVNIDNENANTFGQEIRLTGFWKEINWMVGTSYFYEGIQNEFNLFFDELSIGSQSGPIILPSPPAPPPGFAFTSVCDPALAAIFTGGVQCSSRLLNSYRQEGDYHSFALYGDGTWAVMEGLNLTLGLRFSYDLKDFRYNAPTPLTPLSVVRGSFNPANPLNILGFNTGGAWVEDSKDWNSPQPRVAIDYKVTDDAMIYASVARGFKSGGFDPTGLAPDGSNRNVFTPEDVWAYEVGLKSNWWDNRVMFNTAAFVNDYNGFQLQTLDGAVLVTRNASDVLTAGLEAELVVEPIDNWQTFFGGAYLYSEFSDFQEVIEDLSTPDPTDTIAVDFSGNQLPRAPEGTFSVVSQYDHPLLNSFKMIYRIEAAYTSLLYFSHRNTALESQPDFWLLNGRITFGDYDDMWRFTFWAKNITDEDYLQDTRNTGAFGTIRAAGSPRYFGLEISGQLDSLPGWLKL